MQCKLTGAREKVIAERASTRELVLAYAYGHMEVDDTANYQSGLLYQKIVNIYIYGPFVVQAVTAFHNMEYGVTFIKLREMFDTYTYTLHTSYVGLELQGLSQREAPNFKV